MRRGRIFPAIHLAALVVAGLACGPGTARLQDETPPAGLTPQEAEPPVSVTEEVLDFVVVTHLEPEFHFYDPSGGLVETRSAEGLGWSRPNTAQVVGNAVYYVAAGDADQGEVVRRVTSTGTTDLDFTRAQSFSGLTFAVSAEGGRIAWTKTDWDGQAPFSQLWVADVDGASPILVAETDAADDIAEYYVLEAVAWLGDGDLIYAWQVTGIGGYILFFGWSSLYRYDLATGVAVALAPVEMDVTAPCWSDMTPDGAYVLGACGGPAQIVERAAATGVETLFPLLPDQGQAGAAAYSPSGDGLAYAIARGNPDDEAGQVVLLADRGGAPTAIARHTPGAFDSVFWVDKSRMVVGYWQGEQAFVDMLTIDGVRSPIGAGQLVGVHLP